jgi:hypothetical protein
MIQKLKDQYEKNKRTLEDNYIKMKEMYEQGKTRILEKTVYVDEKLTKAKSRADSKTQIKTKEEILLEKNIVELIQSLQQLQPHWDIAQIFPGYKELNLTLPTSTVIKDERIELPKSTEKPLHTPPEIPPTHPVSGGGPDVAKINSLSNQDVNTMSPEELFALVRPNVKNPYANVITNSKAKRKPKDPNTPASNSALE